MARKKSNANVRRSVAEVPPQVPRPESTAAIAAAPQLPSVRKLVGGSIVAFVVAIVVLVIVVLPAEYGVDPTGIGKRLGLRGLSSKQPGMGVAIPAQLASDPFAAMSPVW